MRQKNNIYTLEYKISTVKDYLDSNQSIMKYAKENNIKYQTLYGWISAYKCAPSEEKQNLLEITSPVKQIVMQEEPKQDNTFDMIVENVKFIFKIDDLKKVMNTIKDDRH